MKINEITLTDSKFLNEKELLNEILFIPALAAGGMVLWGLLQVYMTSMTLTEIWNILHSHGWDGDDDTLDTMTPEDWAAVVLDIIMLAVPGASAAVAKFGAKSVLKLIPGKFVSVATTKIKGFFSTSITAGKAAVTQMPKNIKAIDTLKGEKLIASKWDEATNSWKVTYRDAKGKFQSRSVTPPKLSTAKAKIQRVAKGVSVGSAASIGAITANKVGGVGGNVVSAATGGQYRAGNQGAGGAAQAKFNLTPQQQKLSLDLNDYPLKVTFDLKNPKIMNVNGGPITDAEGYQLIGDVGLKHIKTLAQDIHKPDPTIGIPKRPGRNYNH